MNRKDQNHPPAINNLPDELLLRIVLQAISYEDAPHEWFTCRVQHYDARAILMGVCRKWQRLIEESPLLWTSFTIGCYWGDQRQVNIRTPKREYITLWQARTRNSPIHIHLYAGSFTAHTKDGIAMMTALLPSINRWRQIDLSLDQKAAEAFIICNHSTAAGLGVQEIRASTFCDKSEINDQVLVAFGHWPSLQKLTWIFSLGLIITSRPTFYNVLHIFPWKNLLHISLEVSWTLVQFHAFFSSATSAQLIRLNMQRHPSDSLTFYPHSAIHLPELRYLGIEADSCMYRYVGCLNLSSIVGIGLFQKTVPLGTSWGKDPHPVTPSSEFNQFLNQTACSAQVMIIHGYPFSTRTAIDLFNNPDFMNIAVLEIDVGETASVEVAKYMELNSLTERKIECGGKLLGWCYNHTRCDTFRLLFPSLDIDYHTWLHPLTQYQ